MVTNLKRCESCERLADPTNTDLSKPESWVFNDGSLSRAMTRKIIHADIAPIDYCPICTEMYKSDVDFDSSGYVDETDRSQDGHAGAC